MRGVGAAADVRGDGAREDELRRRRRRRQDVGFPAVFSGLGFDDGKESFSEAGRADANTAQRAGVASTPHSNSSSPPPSIVFFSDAISFVLSLFEEED